MKRLQRKLAHASTGAASIVPTPAHSRGTWPGCWPPPGRGEPRSLGAGPPQGEGSHAGLGVCPIGLSVRHPGRVWVVQKALTLSPFIPFTHPGTHPSEHPCVCPSIQSSADPGLGLSFLCTHRHTLSAGKGAELGQGDPARPVSGRAGAGSFWNCPNLAIVIAGECQSTVRPATQCGLRTQP